jgi:CheY-like chemotaxis protein
MVGLICLPRPGKAAQLSDMREMVAGKRIFVVEDETLIAMLLEDMLDELGCEVAGSVPSLQQAIALVDSGQQMDAAILDVELDDGKSWPVAAALEQRNVPFAFSTGHGQVADLDPRFASTPILNKPFDLDGLRNVLTQLLATR